MEKLATNEDSDQSNLVDVENNNDNNLPKEPGRRIRFVGGEESEDSERAKEKMLDLEQKIGKKEEILREKNLLLAQVRNFLMYGSFSLVFHRLNVV